MNPPETDLPVSRYARDDVWSASLPAHRSYAPAQANPSRRALIFCGCLFFLTLLTCLLAGTQFAVAYAHNQAVSLDAFTQTFSLTYRHPAMLLLGLPFAVTLMTILMAHELGHYFACRRHHIRSSYPFFIPGPNLIGTFGAFILIRSPIRSVRALFDVGASGPIVGFIAAIPFLAYGIVNAKMVPSVAVDGSADLIFGTPLILRLMIAVFQPNVQTADLLLHPVARAAWVGLFATALNLLPVGQLDGGHIVRSVSPRLHQMVSLFVPIALIPLGYFQWRGWLVWAAILFGLRFIRMAPIYDPEPLDPDRRFGAVVTLIIFLLCFMPSPLKFN